MSKTKTVEESPLPVANGRTPFVNEALGISFTLPSRLTVREHLAFRTRLNSYFSTLNVEVGDDGEPVQAVEEDVYSPYWTAGLRMIADWQCDYLPDPAALDLDEETDIRVARAVIWTANTIASHVTVISGETVPKN